MSTPMNLRFADSHEWVQDNGDGTATMGISDHAQKALGDVVYVELPEVGTEIEAGSEFALVESVKAASDVYSPVTGTVIEVNEALVDAPETINEHCYTDGWMVKIQFSDESEIEALKDAEAYDTMTEQDD